jgi:hypothetical protein
MNGGMPVSNLPPIFVILYFIAGCFVFGVGAFTCGMAYQKYLEYQEIIKQEERLK